MRARLGADRAGKAMPCVSSLGCLIAWVLTSVVMMGLAMGLFWSGARAQLHEQAGARLTEIEFMIANAVADLDQTASQLTMSCGEGAGILLAERSLTARMLDYLHWVNPAHSSYCSPLPSRRAQIVRSLDVALEQTAGLDQSVVLGGNQGGLLVARRLSEAGGYLVGEITAAQLAMRLSLATQDGGRAILRRWDGVVLHDSAGLTDHVAQSAGGQRLFGALNWGDLFRIRGAAQSPFYPVTIELQPNPVSVVSAGSRYLLAGAVAALFATVFLVVLINRHLVRRSSFERRLRSALDRQEFEPVIQPIVDAQTGECRGGEVLVRWRHPYRGLLAPSEFLETAEQLGMVGELTLIIMRRAREQLSAIIAANPSMYVSFNLEAPQLRDPVFMRQFEAIFEAGALRPENIVIELVEREAVDAQARVALSRLRQRGYRIAIDDFGTGQSSLALLSTIDFDLLKIDRSFVTAAGDTDVNLPVLDAILGLAGKLAVSTIAEGVETKAQHSHLVARGVTSIQGYLVARPMPLAQFGQWLYARVDNPGYAVDPARVDASSSAASSAATSMAAAAIALAAGAASKTDAASAAAAPVGATAVNVVSPDSPLIAAPVSTAPPPTSSVAGAAAIDPVAAMAAAAAGGSRVGADTNRVAADTDASTARAEHRRPVTTDRGDAARNGLSGLRVRPSRIIWQPVLACEGDGLLLV